MDDNLGSLIFLLFLFFAGDLIATEADWLSVSRVSVDMLSEMIVSLPSSSMSASSSLSSSESEEEEGSEVAEVGIVMLTESSGWVGGGVGDACVLRRLISAIMLSNPAR